MLWIRKQRSVREAFLKYSIVRQQKEELFFGGKSFYKIFLSFTVCHINFEFWMKNLNPNKYFKINDICWVLERGQLTACCLLTAYVITLAAGWGYPPLEWGSRDMKIGGMMWDSRRRSPSLSLSQVRKDGPYSRGSGLTCNCRHVSWCILSMGYVDQWKRKYHPVLEGDLLLLLALMSLAKCLK